MRTQTVTIFRGLPGSGKTTKAVELVANSGGKVKRINKDDLRSMIDVGTYSKEREKLILQVRDNFILEALNAGYDVIVDDTNLAPKHIDHITDLVTGWNMANESFKTNGVVKVDDSFLKVPIAECIERDAKRLIPVGKKVIRSMAREFGVGVVEPYFVEGLPECVICDLDGTLALMGKRNPFDASTCEQDRLSFSVAGFLNLICPYFTIFYFSGREEKYRVQTLNWLSAHSMDFHKALVMRPTGNSEKDVIIKGRMFEEHIRGKYNVHVVLDDRDQVVEGWRALGLNCWQVNEGNF